MAAPAAANLLEEAGGEDVVEAFSGVNTRWFHGSSTEGVTVGGIWAYVQALNSQVMNLPDSG